MATTPDSTDVVMTRVDRPTPNGGAYQLIARTSDGTVVSVEEYSAADELIMSHLLAPPA